MHNNWASNNPSRGATQAPEVRRCGTDVIYRVVTSCAALIVAAGRGSRFGGPLPKQYALLGAQTVLRRTLEVLRATSGIDRLQVVIADGDEALYAAAVAGPMSSPIRSPMAASPWS